MCIASLIFYAIGKLISAIIGSVFINSNYVSLTCFRILSSFPAFFLLLQLFLCLYLKIEETPYHYFEKGKMNEFKEKALKLHITDYGESLVYSKPNLRSLFKGWNYKRLLIGCGLCLMHNMSGAKSIMISTYYMLKNREGEYLNISNAFITLFFLIVNYKLIDCNTLH